MSKPVILITNATSRNGSEAAKLLLASGKYTVRLCSRDASKLVSMVEQGAEAVELDSSLESSLSAFKGVDYVYVILPGMLAGSQTATFENFLQAAKKNGVKHIVYLSDINVNCDDHFKTLHQHFEHEQLLSTSSIPFTILRASWFHENTILYHGESIKHFGGFRTCAGSGIWTSVAICDIAAAAVAVLSDTGKHTGKVYILQTEALSDDMLAEKLSKATGKNVTHENMAPEEYAIFLKSQFVGAPWADAFTNGILRLDQHKRESRFSIVSPDLERLLGRKGVPVDAFLTERASAF